MQIKPTIWKDIDDTGLKIEESRLLELFEAAPVKELSTTGKKEREKPKVVELIDASKAKGLAILLSRIKMSYADIKTHIRQIDIDIFSDDQITGMKSHGPTKDELDAVKGYASSGADIGLLGVAEKFYLEIAPVVNIDLHFELMLLMKTYESQIAYILPPLKTILGMLDTVVTDDHFRKVLAVILRVGNYMNGGSSRGGAYGYKLDTLKQLRDLRSNQPGVTLLHYIVELIETDYPEDLEFLKAMEPLKQCLKADIDTISKALADVNTTMGKCKRFMVQAEKLVDDGDFFYPKFHKFDEEHGEELQEAQSNIDKVNKTYAKVITQFGDTADKMKMNEFFGLINDFCDDFKKAHAENERRRAAAEREKEKDKKRNITTAGAKRGALDHMMQKLEDGSGLAPKIGVKLADKSDILGAMAKMRARMKNA